MADDQKKVDGKSSVPSKEGVAVEKANMASDPHSKYEWLIKPCMYYKESFKDCNSFYGQFNSRYTNGRGEDCVQWLTDYKNCIQYTKTGSHESWADLIESEKLRRLERFVTMANNDVWKYREEAPADWHAPLSKQLYSSDDVEYVRSRMNKTSIFRCSIM